MTPWYKQITPNLFHSNTVPQELKHLLTKSFGYHVRLLSGLFSASHSSVNGWLLYGMTWSPWQVSQNRTSNWAGCLLNLINTCCLGHSGLTFWAEWFTLLLSSLQDGKLGPKTGGIERASGNFVACFNNNGGRDSESSFWAAPRQVRANSKAEGRTTGVPFLHFSSWSWRWIRLALLSAPHAAQTFQ